MKRIDLHNDPKIETGFKIPESYFEDFESRIMEKISKEEPKVIPLWKKKTFWVGSVAAAVTICLGTWLYQSNKTNNTIENGFATQQYLAYQNDITTEDIAAQLTDDDITSIEKDLGLYGVESETYINEYLK